MVKKTYWKGIRKAITGSWGRFFSIFALMLLGSFALVGLKVSAPNMERAATAFYQTYQTADLFVMADYGLSEADQEELQALAHAQVEFAYLEDVTDQSNSEALRIFSWQADQTISQYQLVSGAFPTKSSQIALAADYADQYEIGDQIVLDLGQNSQLTQSSFEVVGFVNSSEQVSKTVLGQARAGDGSLAAYGIVLPEAFSAEVYSLARIRYDDLEDLNPFSAHYHQLLGQQQADLSDLLSDNGQERLDSLVAAGQAEIDKAQAEVDAGQTKLDQAAQTYAQAEALMTAEQKATYQTERKASQDKLEEARQKIAASQVDLSALTEPTYQVLTKSSLPGGEGYVTFESSLSSIATVANIFPLVLYAVAAMVTLTTMTRFVDEERTNSGILKALGYTNPDVVRKFTIYGLVAGGLGTLLGVLAGLFFLPPLIAQIVMSSLNLGMVQPQIYWDYVALAFSLSLVFSVLPALIVAGRELGQQPSVLLRPKPPVSGSSILLERIPFIWRRLSFTHKVTARNIFRYKQRMLMTIFGVAGSVALLFAGLGIRSSIGGIIDSQFGRSMTYDMIVVENPAASQTDLESLDKILTDADLVSQEAIYFEASQQPILGSEDKLTVNLLVTSSGDFDQQIKLTNQETGKPLSLTDEGVVVSTKFAQLNNLQPGDQLTYEQSDGTKVSLTISAIGQVYAGHYLLMSQAYYEKTFGQELVANAHMLSLTDSGDGVVIALAKKLMAEEGVAALIQNLAVIKTARTVVKSLNNVMLLLVVVSVLLAMVILYNLTTINVAERLRELSTIKVLGFHNREVTLYIYRETISLSLLGIALGLVAGFGLHRYIIAHIGSQNLTFDPQVALSVYLIPVVAVSLILAGLGILVNSRLKHLDMLEALKSMD